MNRHELLGAVRDGKVCLTDIGEIASREWLRVPDSFDTVRLDEFVIMPNHMHAIIELIPQKGNRIGLGNVVRQFRSRVTNCIKKELGEIELALWQRGYHDRIIRDANEFNAIRAYIRQNPVTWEQDEYFLR